MVAVEQDRQLGVDVEELMAGEAAVVHRVEAVAPSIWLPAGTPGRAPRLVASRGCRPPDAPVGSCVWLNHQRTPTQLTRNGSSVLALGCPAGKTPLS